MLHILIIDTNQHQKSDCLYSLEILKEYVGDISCVKSSEEALTLIESKKVDVVLINTSPKNDYLKIEKFIRLISPDIPLLFYSSGKNYAYQGFEINPKDYFLTLINVKRLKENLDNILGEKKSGNKLKRIAIRSSSSIEIIEIEEIVFIEKQDRKSVFHIRNGRTIETKTSISSIEEKLHNYDFFRPYQSYLIPLKRVKKFM